MTTYAFPTFTRALPLADFQFGQEPNDRIFSSPLSGQVQTLELPGTRWALSIRLSGLSVAERLLLDSFMAKLRGRANRFTCWDLMNPRPRGTLRGTPTVSAGVAQGGVSCSISAGGGQAGTTVLEGDKLAINGELKIITAPATLDGSGNATLTVEPPFRSSVSAGAAVVWDKPTALFVRTEGPWRMNYQAPRFGDIALDAVEAFS